MGEVIAFRPRGTTTRTADRRRTRGADLAVGALHRTDAGPDTGQPDRTAPRPGERLWREVTGVVLRDERRRQDRTLAQVAQRAGMSVQYLSELERGRKDASSEMLAAACGALGMSLPEFALRCAGALTHRSSTPGGPVLLAA